MNERETEAKAAGNYTHWVSLEGAFTSSQCAGNESRELCPIQGCVQQNNCTVACSSQALLAHQGAFIFVVLPAPLEKWSRTAAQQPDPVGWGDASGTLSDTSPCAPEPSNEAAQRSGP